MTRTLTLQQAARATRTHTVVIYRAIQRGALHATQSPAGDGWLIDEHCLAAWLDRRTCTHGEA